MADFIKEIGHLDFSPRRDARQNFFTCHFAFLMNHIKKNHPRNLKDQADEACRYLDESDESIEKRKKALRSGEATNTGQMVESSQ